MNDRREPTISGLKVDPEDPRAKARPATGQASAKRPPQQSRPQQRPVVVKSKSVLAPIAFLVAIVACGAAGYVFWLLQESNKALNATNQRLVAIEQTLKMTGSESMESVTAINERLKVHMSEIDKLWAVYRRHKSQLNEAKAARNANKKQMASASAQLKSMAGEFSVASDLIDAQQNALSQVEKSNAAAMEQSQKMTLKAVELEQTLAEINNRIKNTEKDIEAINGFRRSVNQQLLQLKGGAK